MQKRRAFRSGAGAPQIKEANVILWFRYIAERQRVFHNWFNRAPNPWTLDMTITSGRMCNVHRFLDRESVWSIANIVEPLRHKPADLLFNIIMFRCYFNWHKSAELVGLQSTATFDRTKFEAGLRMCAEPIPPQIAFHFQGRFLCVRGCLRVSYSRRRFYDNKMLIL